jgi:hypothetical protein
MRYQIAELPTWLQAVAEIVLVFITGWTLAVLRGYAADTKIIAKSSSEQVENSQIPFVTLVMKTDETRLSNPFVIRNQGLGTAMNIYYHHYLGGDKSPVRWLTPLAPRDEYPLPRENKNQNFMAEFESLSGAKYRTTNEWVDGKMKTTFQRIRDE